MASSVLLGLLTAPPEASTASNEDYLDKSDPISATFHVQPLIKALCDAIIGQFAASTVHDDTKQLFLQVLQHYFPITLEQTGVRVSMIDSPNKPNSVEHLFAVLAQVAAGVSLPLMLYPASKLLVFRPQVCSEEFL